MGKQSIATVRSVSFVASATVLQIDSASSTEQFLPFANAIIPSDVFFISTSSIVTTLEDTIFDPAATGLILPVRGGHRKLLRT